jgi:hypothetical protein
MAASNTKSSSSSVIGFVVDDCSVVGVDIGDDGVVVGGALSVVLAAFDVAVVGDDANVAACFRSSCARLLTEGVSKDGNTSVIAIAITPMSNAGTMSAFICQIRFEKTNSVLSFSISCWLSYQFIDHQSSQVDVYGGPAKIYWLSKKIAKQMPSMGR